MPPPPKLHVQLLMTLYKYSSILVFYFRYIHHTISENEILMQINPGSSSHLPLNPSHATLTVESQNPKTNSKEVTR